MAKFAKLSHFCLCPGIMLGESDFMGFYSDIAREVRTHRKSKNWSQDRLADKAEVARKTIGRLEAGKPVHAHSILKVTKVLGIDPFEINEQLAFARRLEFEVSSMRKIRLAKHLPIEECADAAGVSVATFSRWERELSSPAKLVTIRPDGTWYANNQALAEFLGFSGLRDFTREIGGYDEFVPRHQPAAKPSASDT